MNDPVAWLIVIAIFAGVFIGTCMGWELRGVIEENEPERSKLPEARE